MQIPVHVALIQLCQNTYNMWVNQNSFHSTSHRKSLCNLQSGNFTAVDIKLTIQAAILHLFHCNPFKMAASAASLERLDHNRASMKANY